MQKSFGSFHFWQNDKRKILRSKAAYWLKIYGKIEFILIILSALIALLSLAILLNLTPLKPNSQIVGGLIIVNSLLALALAASIFIRLKPLVSAYRKHGFALNLHIKIIALFSLIATIPALLLALIAALSFNFAFERWLNKDTNEMLRSSIQMANIYAQESLKNLADIALIMSKSLDDRNLFWQYPQKYRQAFALQRAVYKLNGAFLLTKDASVIIGSVAGKNNIPIPPAELINKAQDKEPFFFQPGRYNFFGAIIKLRYLKDSYLYLVKEVNQAAQALRLTESSSNRYRFMQANYLAMSLAFSLLYLCLFLVIWLCAIISGIRIADSILQPLDLLTKGAATLGKGDFSVRLPLTGLDSDLAQLAKSFNYMVQRLFNQHQALLKIRDHLDDRRRFIEAVLEAVSLAIIAVNEKGNITIINHAAQEMFKLSAKEALQKNLALLDPAIANSFFEIKNNGQKRCYKQLTLEVPHQSCKTRHLILQIALAKSAANKDSWIITIDDITQLAAAQRAVAWTEIAKRIAHEIKNPLTAIQLACEQIAKIAQPEKAIGSKGAKLSLGQYNDIIARQAKDLRHMIDEFSAFARMPKPNFAIHDLNSIVSEALLIMEVQRPDIIFEAQLSTASLWGKFDNRLLMQALINLLSNSAEAIDAWQAGAKNTALTNKARLENKGHIILSSRSSLPKEEGTSSKTSELIIEIMDNGQGLPLKDRQKLFEPYITRHKQGRGLGLAIVKKIIEEHGASIELENARQDFYQGRGALIRLCFAGLEAMGD